MPILSTRILISLLCCLLAASPLTAQDIQLTGRLLEADSQSPLPYANIQNLTTGNILSTDSTGRFSFMAHANDSIEFSFIGYKSAIIPARRVHSATDIMLTAQATTLNEVEIIGNKSVVREQFLATRAGKQVVKKDILLQLPSLAGEPDIIKVVTLLPGATKGVEGTNDFFIRGGAADQNLVLFDGATAYSTGHLFGFLSVFNPSTIGGATILTGGFPAEYGGRLSSIIDVRSKRISKTDLFVEGGIGLISSRVSAEIPLIENKLAIQVAGRRTYADQVVRLVDLSLPYYFYDANVNIDWQATENSSLRYSFYLGEDVLDFSRVRNEDIEGDAAGTAFRLGNIINTLTLTRSYDHYTSDINLYHSTFNYKINSFFQDNFINVLSDIEEIGLSKKVMYPLDSNLSLHLGVSTIHRIVDPNLINSGGEIAEIIPSGEGAELAATETALFGGVEQTLGKLHTAIGLRLSGALLKNNFYWQPEPRLSLRYAVQPNTAIKASYTRMAQYIHRVSSSSFALPTDIWYPVDDQVKPQTANQWTLGVNTYLPTHRMSIGMELYYKTMNNLVEFEEGTNLVLNNDFRKSLIQGSGSSYGLEWLARKEFGRSKGWISYTLSWTTRTFDQLNEGRTFPARYDRRHNAALVGSYDLNSRWSVSLIWEFISGARFTPTIGYYAVPNAATTGIDLIPIYPERNSVKLADSHRLDLSLILKGRQRPGRKWSGDWHFSVYNAYNRATPVAIDINYNEETGSYSYEQPGLLGLLPSVSYNFKFIK